MVFTVPKIIFQVSIRKSSILELSITRICISTDGGPSLQRTFCDWTVERYPDVEHIKEKNCFAFSPFQPILRMVYRTSCSKCDSGDLFCKARCEK